MKDRIHSPRWKIFCPGLLEWQDLFCTYRTAWKVLSWLRFNLYYLVMLHDSKDFQATNQSFIFPCKAPYIVKVPSTLCRRNLKTEVSLWRKRIKCFPSTLHRRNLKHNNNWASRICVWKEFRAGKSQDYHEAIVFQKLHCCLQNVNVFCQHENEKRAFSNSSSLKKERKKGAFLNSGELWTGRKWSNCLHVRRISSQMKTKK